MPKDKFVASLRHVLKQLEPLNGTLLIPSESDGDLAIDFDDIKQRLSSIYLEIQQDKNAQPSIKRVKEEGNEGGAEISRFCVLLEEQGQVRAGKVIVKTNQQSPLSS